ncbi:transcription-repair coupling factor [Anaerovorax odorimutans]|uniref:Transcription-repair-coupling factor n=1 Tax=Anaerovorax odorimutans TaxID=109327 RepID=A0ABT1RPG7_9FIRM|nr:transcription-repair coupling factor [Anaerovorax odorimutans]MCQ4637065.1 transcription-repair coupling factor [Anaerovorax odorimutans]
MIKKGMINITGAAESRVAPVIGKILKDEAKGQCLVVVPSYIRAKRLATDLSFFVDKNIYVLPPEEEGFIRYEAKNHDQMLQRLRILKALRTGEDCLVVAPATGAIRKLPPHESFDESSVKLTLGEDIDLDQVKEKLVRMGYERVPVVDAKGEFSIRGAIIDIFTADAEAPYRVELFDTEIDSIRSFDLDTQRSIENLKFIEVYPAEQLLKDRTIFEKAAVRIKQAYGGQIRKFTGEGVSEEDLERGENLRQRRDQLIEFAENCMNLQQLENFLYYFYDETEYIWDYMQQPVIMIDDPARCYENLEARDRETVDDFQTLLERGQAVPGDLKHFSNKSDFLHLYDLDRAYLFTPFQKTIKGVESLAEIRNVVSKPTLVFNGKMDLLESEVRSYLKNGYKVTIVCANEERVSNMEEFLERAGLLSRVWVKLGNLTGGIDFPEEKFCYIWDGDIFGTPKKKKRKKKAAGSAGQPIKSFADMQKGDYVVHENHGIGKFMGIEQLTVQNVKKDYLKIKYSGQDILYVPVEQMDIIQKYVGADTGNPKLNKLSGSEWKTTKAKAKAAIANMAKELLEVSAARQLEKGHAFSTDTVWQKEFEDSFPYTETDDQLRCIEEIKQDMEKDTAMDRLLCGDVGFGKTEVAARAMFKCAADGKQAAVLVPTTILANQHYYTLKERFEKFPFKVEMLSRFRSDAQQKAVIDGLEKGSVDVVIGTHRILSKDVKFKDLGLLVIDEEQRFGVQHKEVIKQLRKNVDVLTLSATPIPRTLHMSLVGIKDMSVIEEPPEERYPVQTYVLEQEDMLIRDAIEKELDRGGQVYVVFNRVKGINKLAAHIEELVPQAQVAVGHGQMNEHHLEDVIMGFVQGESNVLVATTIIESGIDIPNVNTMVILDADRFGLSQLYQLRGRVGRSNRMSYAYLMFQKDKSLSEVAEKRLRAIKEFTEFGAGFKVAMRDLEIRGAGNLLGTEQHGHMMNIGYELYCKLVDDAVRALGGEVVNPDREEASIELNVTALIPDRYISDEVLKLQMYKKIATVASDADEEEIIDELIDRFGEIPRDTMNLITISRIRSMAEKLCITRIHEEGSKVIFNFAQENGLSAKSLSALSAKYGMRLFIHGGVKPFVRFTPSSKKRLPEILEFLQVAEG